MNSADARSRAADLDVSPEEDAEMTMADEIWNRACGGGGSNPRPGGMEINSR